METNITIFIYNLSLPYNTDLKNSFIEFEIDNKKATVPYPQQAPLPIVLSPKFIQDNHFKQLIRIMLKIKIQKKYKNLAYGKLMITKNNLLES